MEKKSVVIKSLPYNGRYGFRYRQHSVQVLDADEAAELVKAGIADYHGDSIPKRVETMTLDPAKGAEIRDAAPVVGEAQNDNQPVANEGGEDSEGE